MPPIKTKKHNPSLDIALLTKLLDSPNTFISGSQLALELGISRVSVWGHLDALRNQGFDFEAVRNRGYTLKKLPKKLNPTLIQAYLNLLSCSTPLIFEEELDSTQNEAERQLALSAKTPFVVIARKMTAGRGRLGRKWTAPDNGNLYSSFAFKPNLPPARMQHFSLWIALNICDLLNTQYSFPVRLKWPNDLHLEGKKMSGFLAEARIDADHTRDLVLGIGLNINADITKFPLDLQPKVTSLYQYIGKKLDINSITAKFINTVTQSYNEFINTPIKDKFNELWNKYDLLTGKTIDAFQNNKKLTGTAKGIDSNGNLLLELSDKSIMALHSAEVSLSQPS